MSSKQTSALPKQAVFQAPEGFMEAMPKVQITMLKVWVAANPGCIIEPIEGRLAEGGLPPYLRMPDSKRARIHRLASVPIGVTKFMLEAAKDGGGYPDLLALVAGGFGPSASTWGTAFVRLVSTPTATN
jgi:hypothetical protein